MNRFQLKSMIRVVVGVLFVFHALALAQGRILHTPPDKAAAGRSLEITCQLQGVVSPVRLLRVYYRRQKDDNFKFVLMQQKGDLWTAVIPGSDIAGPRLQYFIVAALQDDALLSYPWRNAKSQPEEIVVIDHGLKTLETTEGPSPILILAPEPDQILEPRTAFFALSLVTPSVELDPASVRIVLDGRDVTAHAVFSEFVATFNMKTLAVGKHVIKVYARDKDGDAVAPAQLMFFIKERKVVKKIKSNFSGRVFAEGRREQIYNRDQSFFMGGADFSGNYGSLDYQGRLFLTSLEDAGAQPRNRFFLSVGNDYFQVQAGDIYPRYNDLIVWGKRVRGLAGAVQTGAARLEAVYGETYRAVEGVAGQGTNIARYGDYRQLLLGVKPSLNFQEKIKIGLSMVKIKDDAGSITFGGNPKDNVIIGPDFLLSLDNGRIELRAQGAYSMITYDASLGAFSQDAVADIFGYSVDIPINPKDFESLFIINDTTVPLNPLEFTSTAYDVNVKLHYFRNMLRFGYKSIAPDYFSLANSWLRRDIRGFYLTDRVRLWQNKIYASLGIERYKDHYSEQGSPATDLNSINFDVSYYPGRGLPHLNVSMRDYQRVNGVTDMQLDSLQIIGEVDTVDIRENSRQRDLSIQLGYQFRFLNASHYLTLSYISAIKSDKFRDSRVPGYFPQKMTSNIKMFSWTATVDPLRATLSYSTNSNVLGDGLSDFNYNSINAFAEYRFFRTLTTFAEMRFASSDGLSYANEKYDVRRSHVRIGGSIHFKPRQSLLLEAFLISVDGGNSASAANSSYTDHLVRLRYEKLF